MQEKLLLTADIESESFAHGTLPRSTKFLIQCVLNEDGGSFVISVSQELVEGHRAYLYGFVTHFGGHVRVLLLRKNDKNSENKPDRIELSDFTLTLTRGFFIDFWNSSSSSLIEAFPAGFAILSLV